MGKDDGFRPLRSHRVLLTDQYAVLNARSSGLKREWREQRELFRWLEEEAVLPNGEKLGAWHTPNELAARSGREGAQNKALGVKAGIPDVLISDRVPGKPEIRGVAIELKVEGRKPSKAQRWWLEKLERDGWLTFVCQGAEEAKKVLRRLFW